MPCTNGTALVGSQVRDLKQTKHYRLRYTRGDESLRVYSDADWAAAVNKNHSTSGVLLMLGGGLVVFGSRKQKAVAMSSTEAEYIAANESTLDLMWLTDLLSELGHHHSKPTLSIDNQSTIKQIQNKDVKKRSRHVGVAYRSVRQQWKHKLFDLLYIETNKQPADILTKPLGGSKLRQTIEQAQILITEPNKEDSLRRMNVPKPSPALLALLCVSLLAIGATGSPFQQHDPSVWLESKYSVITRTEDMHLYWKPISACNFMVDTYGSEQDVKRTIYNGLKAECENTYQNTVALALDEFSRCLAKFMEVQHGKRRHKRFIDPITLIIGKVVVVTVLVVSAIGTTLYSWLSPNSSSNRLDEVEKREKERAEADRKRDEKMAQMEEALRHAKELRQDLARIQLDLNARIHSNRMAIGDLATLLPSAAMTGSNLTVNMYDTRRQLEEMTAQCQKRRAAPVSYANVLKAESLRDVHPSNTFLKTVTKNRNGQIYINLWASIESSDSKILQMHGMPHFKYMTENRTIAKPVLMKYEGPRLVLYNTTSNCARGVTEPSQPSVVLTCLEPNFLDLNLANWREVPPSDPEYAELKKPSYIQTPTENIVHCATDTIEVFNRTVQCPWYPFRLSRDVTFRTRDIEYVVTHVEHSITEEHPRLSSPNLEIHGTDADFERETKVINKFIDDNEKSVDASFSGVKGKVLVITWDAQGIRMIFSIISFVATAYTFLRCCSKRLLVQPGQDSGHERHSSSEHINVFNTGPAPTAAPSYPMPMPLQMPMPVHMQVPMPTQMPVQSSMPVQMQVRNLPNLDSPHYAVPRKSRKGAKSDYAQVYDRAEA